MNILGIGFVDHEAAVALVVDGVLKTAIARERLSRIKRDGNFWGTQRLDPTLAVAYCLEANGLHLEDVDLVVWNHIDHIPVTELFDKLKSERGLDLSGIPQIPLPHHFAHACCAFYLSPFEDAAVLVADGTGGPLGALKDNCQGPEVDALRKDTVIVQNFAQDKTAVGRELESFYHFRSGDGYSLRKIVGTGGIGAGFGAASELLFGDCLDSGKTMGLASYGRPLPEDLFLRKTGPDDHPAYQFNKFGKRQVIEAKITAYLAAAPLPIAYEDEMLADYSASIQRETEEALLAYAGWLKETTASRQLCVAGGVALNCVANSRLVEESGFDEVFVPSAPGDDGIAIGCALYGAQYAGELKRTRATAFLGRVHEHRHDHEAFSAENLEEVALGDLTFEDAVARYLAEGAVVAWYQVASEFGPRALGHRSFLADPRAENMVDHLNRVVKRREAFRPFAPVVLEEVVFDYFSQRHPSTFMSFVATVREDKRPLVPAITHADGTARYQVLKPEDNPALDLLIRAFQRLTGIGLLLNTSFNRAGEPIVETPAEAARCAIAASANYLALDGRLYDCKAPLP